MIDHIARIPSLPLKNCKHIIMYKEKDFPQCTPSYDIFMGYLSKKYR